LLADQPQLASPIRVFAVWSLTYLFANVCGSVVISALGYAGTEVVPTWVLALSALTLWGPFIAVLAWISQSRGSGNVVQDFSLTFQVKDLWGIPLGIASQLLLVVLVTLPFQWLFPSLFNSEAVEKRANDLFDAAHGTWIVLLVVVVVICAPLVEEIVYRGFIQRNLGTAYGPRISLLISSFWFAAVHLQLAEFPGLFAFALVLGACFSRTKRLGLSIVTHVAFNATALTVMSLTR
jgi:membrane protease YdiL (CAAX protease family)